MYNFTFQIMFYSSRFSSSSLCSVYKFPRRKKETFFLATPCSDPKHSRALASLQTLPIRQVEEGTGDGRTDGTKVQCFSTL